VIVILQARYQRGDHQSNLIRVGHSSLFVIKPFYLRARDGRHRFDNVQQNDFAAELFGKLRRVPQRLFRRGGLQSAAGPSTNFRTFAGKATFPEPREVAAHVCYAPKTKSLNCLGANMRDGFFNRIRRINQF
jgi:hypothetical protein